MLPKGWTVRYSKSHQNRPYYFNELTGATQWEPPAMEDAPDTRTIESTGFGSSFVKEAAIRFTR